MRKRCGKECDSKGDLAAIFLSSRGCAKGASCSFEHQQTERQEAEEPKPTSAELETTVSHLKESEGCFKNCRVLPADPDERLSMTEDYCFVASHQKELNERLSMILMSDPDERLSMKKGNKMPYHEASPRSIALSEKSLLKEDISVVGASCSFEHQQTERQEVDEPKPTSVELETTVSHLKESEGSFENCRVLPVDAKRLWRKWGIELTNKSPLKEHMSVVGEWAHSSGGIVTSEKTGSAFPIRSPIAGTREMNCTQFPDKEGASHHHGFKGSLQGAVLKWLNGVSAFPVFQGVSSLRVASVPRSRRRPATVVGGGPSPLPHGNHHPAGDPAVATPAVESRPGHGQVSEATRPAVVGTEIAVAPQTSSRFLRHMSLKEAEGRLAVEHQLYVFALLDFVPTTDRGGQHRISPGDDVILIRVHQGWVLGRKNVQEGKSKAWLPLDRVTGYRVMKEVTPHQAEEWSRGQTYQFAALSINQILVCVKKYEHDWANWAIGYMWREDGVVGPQALFPLTHVKPVVLLTREPPVLDASPGDGIIQHQLL